MHGHLLWSGIVDDDKVERVASHLMGERLYLGLGRAHVGRPARAATTRSATTSGRCGRTTTRSSRSGAGALRVPGRSGPARDGACSRPPRCFGNRLPEAFAGFPREQTRFPAEYPTACSPQAWASGAPLMLLRAMLGLEPDGAVLRCDPHLPERIRRLELFRVPGRWGVTDAGVDVTGQVLIDLPAQSRPWPVVQEILFAARQIPAASTLGEHASIGFDLSEAGQYRLVADDGRLSLDARADEADCVLATDAPTLVELLRGDRNPTTTIYSGRARLTGDVQLATRLLGFLWRQGVGPR